MMRTWLENYINLEPDDGRAPFFEYTGNRASFGLYLSHRHLMIGAWLDLWDTGEPVVHMHLGPLVATVNMYPDLRS